MLSYCLSEARKRSELGLQPSRPSKSIETIAKSIIKKILQAKILINLCVGGIEEFSTPQYRKTNSANAAVLH